MDGTILTVARHPSEKTDSEETEIPYDLPNFVWILHGIIGLAFIFLTIKSIETGIEKWDRRQFRLEEQSRLNDRLSAELAELEKYQNAIHQMMK